MFRARLNRDVTFRLVDARKFPLMRRGTTLPRSLMRLQALAGPVSMTAVLSAQYLQTRFYAARRRPGVGVQVGVRPKSLSSSIALLVRFMTAPPLRRRAWATAAAPAGVALGSASSTKSGSGLPPLHAAIRRGSSLDVEEAERRAHATPLLRFRRELEALVLDLFGIDLGPRRARPASFVSTVCHLMTASASFRLRSSPARAPLPTYFT